MSFYVKGLGRAVPDIEHDAADRLESIIWHAFPRATWQQVEAVKQAAQDYGVSVVQDEISRVQRERAAEMVRAGSAPTDPMAGPRDQ